ncbi:iron compound ABC transporter iron compound-binding protein [Planobispora rosea]|uniref:Iron compound ABC transporter iron compound-binding protein n=1 Tax=Planobispora rosea TaxID=35762 RepID=A0A8J3SB33_PLARO|nr:ABC transporter substrate-binding protein [Planobispora rosea]GGS61772.1 iron compound ABC transporter iron compound-binding protein [Planobispora rosea]GIH86563.1 iron compound ABC transporter iron compound-binding protein [Planobispora rosea]
MLRRFLPAVLCATLLSGCGAGASPSPGAGTTTSGTPEAAAATSAAPSVQVTPVTAALTVTDPAGKQITLTEKPERIVCLTGICDDMLVELGLTPAGTTTPKLLARPDYLGAAAGQVPVIPGSFGGEDVAKIAEQRPDLVIGLAGVHDQLRTAVEKFAPLWVVEVKDYEHSVGYLRALARLTDRGAQQAEAERRFRTKLAEGAATAKARGLDGTTVLAMYGGSSVGVNTTDDVLGDFMSEFFAYPWPSKGGGFETAQAYSVEEILAKAPDVIFIQSFTFGPDAKTVTETLRDNPVWKRVPAVANGRAFEVQPELWASGRGTRAFGIILDEALAKVSG